MNELSKIFFNSVEEMNECYGVGAEIPSNLYSNTELVCYEIVEPFVYEYVGQYVFTNVGFHHLNNLRDPVINNRNIIKSEFDVCEYDTIEWDGRCFAYVRVNDYLRKHLEKSLLGCEFVSPKDTSNTLGRRFVHSVEARTSGIVVIDQYGYDVNIVDILFYPDDYSDPIPYKEWVKQINEQDVED